MAQPPTRRPPEGSEHPDARGGVVLRTEGPLPSPRALAEYEQAAPGAADRILRVFEAQSQHRQDVEMTALRGSVSDAAAGRREARWGQFFALLIGLAALASGTHLGAHDAQTAGSIIGGGGVVGLVTVFIRGRSREDAPKD